MFDRKNELLGLLESADDDVNICIGRENGVEALEGSSLVFKKIIVNGRAVGTVQQEADGKPFSFQMKAAPLSASIFSYTPYTEKEKQQILQKKLENEALKRAKKAEEEAKEATRLAAIAKEEADKAKEEARAALERAQAAIEGAKQAEEKARKEMEAAKAEHMKTQKLSADK